MTSSIGHTAGTPEPRLYILAGPDLSPQTVDSLYFVLCRVEPGVQNSTDSLSRSCALSPVSLPRSDHRKPQTVHVGLRRSWSAWTIFGGH